MVKDGIANLIIKIKNGSRAHQDVITTPHSKLSEAILFLLEKEGYIKSFATKGKKVVKTIDVELAYDEAGVPRIEEVERVSKLSKRVYSGSKEIKSVRSGYGMLVLSTPKGVMSDKQAKKLNVGGEVLFKIW